MEHTETPWEIGTIIPLTGTEIGGYIIYPKHDDDIIICRIDGITDEAKTNAEFIVKACNSYDMFCNLLLASIDALGDVAHMSYKERGKCMENLKEAFQQALAKATGLLR
jgi:hypothetical protein